MESSISINLTDHKRSYQPGEPLDCEFRVDVDREQDLQSIEASVMWYTEGTGDEDMAVHLFTRRVRGDGIDGPMNHPFQITTELPNSPLSYQGVIVKIHWCVRVRAFLRGGKQVHRELPFQLGQIHRAKRFLAGDSFS